ncbi:ABC transporter permease [Saccharospirillum sp. MSK14-1]|uniref:ABC transporter permease n=1 Tax=Saccharospirillum sp. MSK14-1 TaxID=1897632 RepID=UPI000D34DFC6|nr:ABC transporter permease [Saccharospirillum sp. MSK14-1]PTY36027.1 ABC transporter permease [Saccharospirillum sp. MSK14-1]
MRWLQLTPVGRQRWQRFKANRRAWWSLWIFGIVFVVSMASELVANDQPLLVWYDGQPYFPVATTYLETDFGGDFELPADYRDPYMRELIADSGWILWPPIPYSYNTINYDLPSPAPSPPTANNWLGTDDKGRDVVANLLYGFRISVLFGFAVTVITAVIGIAAGAVQGFYGGRLDLFMQRFIEIWSSMPQLFILIILMSIVTPGFGWLLLVTLLFGWMGFVGVVRAEFLRARNFEYVQAARAMGMSDGRLMFRHILPNAMVATLTFMPFTLSGSITILTSLDFLGFGMPPGSPSLGLLLAQGKANIQAPWLGFTAFFIVGFMLTTLIFIGEGVRDAFDPRKAY